MNRKLLIGFAFVVGSVFLSGCWYSPWENLAYKVVAGPWYPDEVVNELIGHGERKFDAYRIDGSIFRAMLRGEGAYTEEHGPYTLWLIAAKKSTAEEVSQKQCVNVQRIVVSRSGHTLWEQCNVRIEMEPEKPISKSKWVTSGYKKFLLPDILNAKDGKNVYVKVFVEAEGGSVGVMEFEFRPTIERGWFITPY